jgi:hypothetical protein
MQLATVLTLNNIPFLLLLLAVPLQKLLTNFQQFRSQMQYPLSFVSVGSPATEAVNEFSAIRRLVQGLPLKTKTNTNTHAFLNSRYIGYHEFG